MVTRYGGTSSRFTFGIDHGVYHQRDIPRDADTVVLYGRGVTPRRAVPLALLAVQELIDRRPQTRILSFGNRTPVATSFDHEDLGVLDSSELAGVFARGTVGLVLSMTNYSVTPQEMLACGMPVVELAGVSGEGVFGTDGGVTFTDFDPLALADALQRLLDDPDEWARCSAQGLSWARCRTWDRSAEEVEEGLRTALRLAAGLTPAPRTPPRSPAPSRPM